MYEISGVIPERYVEGLLEVCQLNSYERLQVHKTAQSDSSQLFYFQEQVDIMMCEGFSGHQLISQLHDHMVNGYNFSLEERVPLSHRKISQVENACLTDQQKSAIAERLAVAEHCLLEGADEYLQASSIF